jgi:protein gp37
MRRALSWEVVEGCVKVSQGCKNCYAEQETKDFHAPRMRPDRLMQPFEWPDGMLLPVCDRADLFQDAVTDEFIRKVFDVIAQRSSQTFIVLTKRAERMARILADYVLPNVWLGVSAENQEEYDRRVPYLAGLKARIKFASLQPLLEAVNLGPIKNVDHVVVGGEYGSGARDMNEDWVRSIYQDTRRLGVTMLYRQKNTPDGVVYTPLLDGVIINDMSLMRRLHGGNSTASIC